MAAPYVPDADCETHEFRNPLGETIRFVTRLEAEQRMMPPVSITSVRVPQSQGAAFRGARHSDRLATIPVVVPSAVDDRDELRRWAAVLDPVKGEGTLTVVQGPWAGRQLVCAYETGLETLSEQYGSPLELTTLAFRASDPYWRDAIESAVTATIDSTAFTWFPFLPLVLGSSDVFASVVIDNSGDVEAWPIIRTTGPGTDLTATNLTTGLAWHFTGSIAAGSVLEVDSRPGHKTVRLDGNNAFGRLTPDSVLWPLVPGPNRISIAFAGGTSASSVHFEWRNRWLSA